MPGGAQVAMDLYPQKRAGLAMGGAAILLWSLSSACIVGMGKRLGVWQFLAITPVIGGALQIACHLAMGRSLRAILLPPPKLWIAIVLGYVLYMILYTQALVSSATDAQAVGVSLANYLWPTLTVLFTVWLVPGAHMHGRLAAGMVLSLAGVVLAIGRDILWPGAGVSIWPYVLGCLAAVSWAVHCALMSRWRHWAQAYAAAPAGFLIVSVVAAGVCLWRGEWEPMDLRIWSGVILTAIGPWAGGYMLWELALHRAPGTTLGLFGSATPVLSTLFFLGMFAWTGGMPASGSRPVVLLASSVLIGAGVVLGSGWKKR
jgi:drug/metabolite transporter (DMT)-like permease